DAAAQQPGGQGPGQVAGPAEEVAGRGDVGDVGGQQRGCDAAGRAGPVAVGLGQGEDQAEPRQPEAEGVQLAGEDDVRAGPAAVEQGDGTVQLAVVEGAQDAH